MRPVDQLGRGNCMQPAAPTTLYTPGLATQLGCAVVRADLEAQRLNYTLRGNLSQPLLPGLRGHVLDALAGR